MGTARRMVGVASLFSFAEQMAASPAPPAGDRPALVSCPGARVDTAVPRLIGRPAADIVAQMQAFKGGQKPSTVMDRIAKGFTDPEIQAIADWYAQQK